MKNEIGFEERKQIQLEMLEEIDEFCRTHHIRYMLAFGTLLGAIRHKGFIPWDDDVDLCMPLEDMMRFKKEFKSNKLKYCDVDTEPYYNYPFSRIAYLPTYSRMGRKFRSYGINIDLYPLVEISNSDDVVCKQIRKAKILMFIRKLFTRIRGLIISVFPIKTIPFYHQSCVAYRDFMLNKIRTDGGGRFLIVAGKLSLFFRHVFSFNPFDELIDVDFEKQKFRGPARYDEFLTTRYGDYMQLPPENERVPYHGGHYYWKEDIH